MTGKVNAKTIIERFGFKDNDLTTPEHDNVLFVFIDRDVVRKLLFDLGIIEDTTYMCRTCECPGHCDWEWDKKTCKNENRGKHYENFLKNFNFKKMNKTKFDDFKVIIEKPIMGGYDNKYNIGFIDIFIKIQCEPFIRTNYFEGYFYKQKNEMDNIYLEIKPKICSVGETIRQINMYRSQQKGKALWMIATYSNEYKDVFASQDITLLDINKYKGFYEEKNGGGKKNE